MGVTEFIKLLRDAQVNLEKAANQKTRGIITQTEKDARIVQIISETIQNLRLELNEGLAN